MPETVLEPGDTMLIEQQTDGPGPASGDYVPSEWGLPVYDAIRTTVLTGIIVVEAAGNGGWDLDDPIAATPASAEPFIWASPGQWTGQINDPLVLRSWNGTAVIGAP